MTPQELRVALIQAVINAPDDRLSIMATNLGLTTIPGVSPASPSLAVASTPGWETGDFNGKVFWRHIRDTQADGRACGYIAWSMTEVKQHEQAVAAWWAHINAPEHSGLQPATGPYPVTLATDADIAFLWDIMTTTTPDGKLMAADNNLFWKVFSGTPEQINIAINRGEDLSHATTWMDYPVTGPMREQVKPYLTDAARTMLERYAAANPSSGSGTGFSPT